MTGVVTMEGKWSSQLEPPAGMVPHTELKRPAGEIKPIKNRIKRPDAVIFDWDETLYKYPTETLATHTKITQTVCENVVKEIGTKPWSTTDELRDLGQAVRMLVKNGKNKEECCDEYFGGISVAEFDRVWQKHWDIIRAQELTMIEPAREILDSLKAKGIPIMIVSNKSRNNVEWELKALKLDGYFDVVVAPDEDFKIKKPSPEPIFRAVDEVNKTRKPGEKLVLGRMWMVGDHFDDAAAAIGAGTSIFVISDQHRRTINENFCDSDAVGGITYLKNLHAFKDVVDTIPHAVQATQRG